MAKKKKAVPAGLPEAREGAEFACPDTGRRWKFELNPDEMTERCENCGLNVNEPDMSQTEKDMCDRCARQETDIVAVQVKKPENNPDKASRPCTHATADGRCNNTESNSRGATCSLCEDYQEVKDAAAVANDIHREFVAELAVSLLRDSSYQTRESVGDVTELAASLIAIGMLHPITARKTDDGCFELIAGHRRARAARLAGWASVPAFVVECDEQTAAEMCATENMQRTDLTPLEEAASVKILLARHSPQEVADRLGRSRQWVARRAALTMLTGEARDAYTDEECVFSRVPMRALEYIAALPPELQNNIVDDINDDCLAPVASAIDRFVIDHHMRDLKRAAFDTEECAGCGKRTGAQPDLFDGGETCELGRCLDKECFDALTRESIKRKAAQHRTKEPDVPLVTDDYELRDMLNVPQVYSYNTCKKGTPGATKAASIGANGKVTTVWLKPNTKSETEKPAHPTPEQKLMAKVCKAVEGMLNGTMESYGKARKEHPFFGQKQEFVLRALLVTGTNFMHSSPEAEEWAVAEDWSFTDLEDRAWVAVQHHLVNRVKYDTIIRCEPFYEEALKIGQRFFNKGPEELREIAEGKRA